LATLTINDNPSISDTIVFDIETPDVNNCFLSDPYKVDKITIYFVARDFASGNTNQYENVDYDTQKLKTAEESEAVACVSPTEANISAAKKARQIADDSRNINTFFYKEAIPVHIIGSEEYPAWLSTDTNNSFIDHTTVDSNGDPIYGRFTYTWNPMGMREGDYFICWSWTSIEATSSVSSHKRFSLSGDTQTTTSIPTHYTNPKKYMTLLERYLPEMFKALITPSDVTPDVLNRMNISLSKGFNVLEDLANQIVDLQDANSVHEFLIPYLSNFFGLKLKTDDPTKWRGQIKRAIPLYKKKGTLNGLYEALEHGGATLNKISQLWQVVSSYTWQESFFYDGQETSFTLSKLLTTKESNFGLWVRKENSPNWVELDKNYVEFNSVDGVTTMIWIGDSLHDSLLNSPLATNDEIRVLYKYQEIPNDQVEIESYIESLPLLDTRDETKQVYPPKNWNVRVIAMDDAMFDVIIPSRHPFHEDIIYGQIRTEFPYGENVYHMDEYNGSLRNSKNPCDIDKNFIDPCGACVSSSYNVDLEIEQISNDKILEVKEIIRENTPFHAVLHTLNVMGGFNEFVESPIENVEMLTNYYVRDFVLAGTAQPYFHRIMLDVENEGIKRNELATSSLIETYEGTAYNDNIVVFCPTVPLATSGVTSGDSFIDIKSPSANAGEYDVEALDSNTLALVDTITEPIGNIDSIFDGSALNSSAFVFDLNTKVYPISGTLCNIYQDNTYRIYDSGHDFFSMNIKTKKDVGSGNWTVSIDGQEYDLIDILPDGGMLLNYDSSLPSSNQNEISYILKDGFTQIISSIGSLKVNLRGRVEALGANVTPVSSIFSRKQCYQKIGSIEYLATGIVKDTVDQYYIEGYDQGGSNGVTVDLREKIEKNKVGYLSYRGLKLEISGNLETELEIQNGVNSSNNPVDNDNYKENFILSIKEQGSSEDPIFYWIYDIDGNNPSGFTTMTLSGATQYWTTAGTTVDVTVYKYTKLGATIQGQRFDLPEHTFESIDRNGKEVIVGIDNNQDTVLSLSKPEGNDLNEYVGQQEEVSFKIDYKKENENE